MFFNAQSKDKLSKKTGNKTHKTSLYLVPVSPIFNIACIFGLT